MVDAVRNVESDPVFEQALVDSKVDNFLGNYDTIDSMLRVSIATVLKEDILNNVQGIVRQQAQKIASILLGRDRNYIGVHHWNEPGHIDVFCALWMGSAETDPEKIMEHAIVIFFNEVLAQCGYSGTDGVLPEQWQFQINAIINRYVYFFLGVDAAAQANLNLGDTEPGTITDDQ